MIKIGILLSKLNIKVKFLLPFESEYLPRIMHAMKVISAPVESAIEPYMATSAAASAQSVTPLSLGMVTF